MKAFNLDLGCGKNKKDGFWGVDERQFTGVDQVVDLRETWPWGDDSIDEVNASHVVEHFAAMDRVHFVNELHRVLKKGAKALLVTPHWCSQRAYGDMTHQWPPVCEFWFYYLNREWRAVNAPHNDFYTCDFDATWGYSMRPDVGTRNQEFQLFAMNNYKEACMDTITTLIKK